MLKSSAVALPDGIGGEKDEIYSMLGKGREFLKHKLSTPEG